jgi:hypothetical protein
MVGDIVVDADVAAVVDVVVLSGMTARVRTAGCSCVVVGGGRRVGGRLVGSS